MHSIPLIKGELYKIYKSKSFIISLLLIFGVLSISFYISFLGTKSAGNWQIKIKQEIAEDKNMVETLQPNDQKYISKINSGIELKQYRLNNNIPPSEKTLFGFLKEYSGITSLVGIIIMLYASNIFSKENSFGTLRLLLIRPYSRISILVSKYIALLILGMLFYLFILFLLVFEGLILFGFHNIQFQDLAIINGRIIKINLISTLIKHYVLNYLVLSSYASIALMISVLIRSSAASITCTLILFVSGGTISAYFQSYSWSKYLFFSNTDIGSFQTNELYMNNYGFPLFSVSIILVYIVFFLLISILFFRKREFS